METLQATTFGPGPETAIRSDCPLLLRVATKSLFATNAFRLLSLPVEANLREISQRAEKLKQMEQLGMAVQGICKAFPLNPPPSFAQVREALQRLKDPEQRLLDEFFWFWPQQFGQSSSDPAIQALSAGDSQTAIQIWNLQESDPAAGVAATHNLAVMWHMTALEFEGRLADAAANPEVRSQVDAHWAKAFKRWQRVVADDRLWDNLNGRVRAVNDVRITTGFTYRLRRSLPEAIFKINGELALGYAAAGQAELARIHCRYVHDAGRGWADAPKTAELVLAPLANRLREHLRLAKVHAGTASLAGAEAASVLAYLAAGSVNTFDLVCGSNSRFRNELFDEVADVCNRLVVAYFNKTSDVAVSLPVMKTVLPLATLDSIKKQIQANVSALEQQLQTRTSLNHRQPAQSAGRTAPAASANQRAAPSAPPSPRVPRPAAEQNRATPAGAASRVLPVFRNGNGLKRRVYIPRSGAKNNSQLAGAIIGCLIGLFLGIKFIFQPATPIPSPAAPPSAPAPHVYPQPVKVGSGFPLSLIAIPSGSGLTNREAGNQSPGTAAAFQEKGIAGSDAAPGPQPIYEIPRSRMGELVQDQSRLAYLRKSLEATAEELRREHARLLGLLPTLGGTGQSEREAALRAGITNYNWRVNHFDQDDAAYNQLVTNYNAKLKALAVENTGSNFK